MGDIRVDNYKKSVQHALERWAKVVDTSGKELDQIDKDLDKLEKIKDPSDDDKKKMEDLRKKAKACRAKVDQASLNLKTDLMLIEPPKDVPEKEFKDFPDWLKKLIKDKGIPLGDNATIVPDINFDFKNMKLKSFVLKVQWKF